MTFVNAFWVNSRKLKYETRIRTLEVLKMLYMGGALYIRRKRYHRFFRRAPRILRISDSYPQIKMNYFINY